jgi:hypothetical protein
VRGGGGGHGPKLDPDRPNAAQNRQRKRRPRARALSATAARTCDQRLFATLTAPRAKVKTRPSSRTSKNLSAASRQKVASIAVPAASTSSAEKTPPPPPPLKARFWPLATTRARTAHPCMYGLSEEMGVGARRGVAPAAGARAGARAEPVAGGSGPEPGARGAGLSAAAGVLAAASAAGAAGAAAAAAETSSIAATMRTAWSLAPVVTEPSVTRTRSFDLRTAPNWRVTCEVGGERGQGGQGGRGGQGVRGRARGGCAKFESGAAGARGRARARSDGRAETPRLQPARTWEVISPASDSLPSENVHFILPAFSLRSAMRSVAPPSTPPEARIVARAPGVSAAVAIVQNVVADFKSKQRLCLIDEAGARRDGAQGASASTRREYSGVGRGRGASFFSSALEARHERAAARTLGAKCAASAPLRAHRTERLRSAAGGRRPRACRGSASPKMRPS